MADTHEPGAQGTTDDFDLDAFFENFEQSYQKEQAARKAAGHTDAKVPGDKPVAHTAHTHPAPAAASKPKPAPEPQPAATGKPAPANAAGQQARAARKRPHPQVNEQPAPHEVGREGASAAGSSADTPATGEERSQGRTPRGSSQAAVHHTTQGQPAKRRTSKRVPHTTGSSPRAPRTGKAKAQQAHTHTHDLADPQSFKPMGLHDSDYRIRGGGTKHNKRPMVLGIAAVIVVVAAVVLIFSLTHVNNLLGTLTGSTSAITLTSDETRAAIDNTMPPLTTFLNYSWDQELSQMTDTWGWSVTTNTSWVVSSPNTGAIGYEYVQAAADTPQDDLNGLMSGSYNAISPSDLQQYFNGAWVLDDTYNMDNHNRYIRLKYANLNGTSIGDEIDYVANKQGLDGNGSTVAYDGQDSKGNTVRLGTLSTGDKVIYWKIAACPFSAVYSPKGMPSTATYVTCTVATFDFYTGTDTVIDAALNASDGYSSVSTGTGSSATASSSSTQSGTGTGTATNLNATDASKSTQAQ